MSAKRMLLIIHLVILMITISGCGTGALMIELVPSEKKLEETRVKTSKGWFVTNKILIIDVDGEIANENQSGLLSSGDNPTTTFIEKLDKAAKDKDVKAVILRINSPGGTVEATDIMHHSLLKFKSKTKKPVIACVTGMACSGAFYLACAADGIITMPSSVVGNIGTIMQTFSVSGTMKLIGIKTIAIKSGELKDIGSPLHELTEKEEEVLQGVIEEMFQQFVSAVWDGRKDITEEKLKALTDGRIFTAKQALDEKLIDRIGYLDDAIKWAQKMADLDKVQVVMYHRPAAYIPNAYSSSMSNSGNFESLVNIDLPDWLTGTRTQFLYLWQPGIE